MYIFYVLIATVLYLTLAIRLYLYLSHSGFEGKPGDSLGSTSEAAFGSGLPKVGHCKPESYGVVQTTGASRPTYAGR